MVLLDVGDEPAPHCRMIGIRGVIMVAAIACLGAGRSAAGQTAAEVWISYQDAYVEAAGLTLLRNATLPSGVREIRAWIGGGYGWPQELFRLTQRDDRVSGEYIRYWGRENVDSVPVNETFAAVMRYHEQGRCGPVTQGRTAEACRAVFRVEPDWQAVWRGADSAGIWTLPDASTLKGGRMVLDGWGITVELRDGESYRAWHYSNPDAQPWPEATTAVSIARLISSVSTLMRRSAAEQVFVGRVTPGADSLELFPCDGAGPWLFLVRDTLLIGTRSSRPAPLNRRVEVRATLVPDFVTRRYWNVSPRFRRTLQVDSVLSIRAWVPTECPRVR